MNLGCYGYWGVNVKYVEKYQTTFIFEKSRGSIKFNGLSNGINIIDLWIFPIFENWYFMGESKYFQIVLWLYFIRYGLRYQFRFSKISQYWEIFKVFAEVKFLNLRNSQRKCLCVSLKYDYIFFHTPTVFLIRGNL